MWLDSSLLGKVAWFAGGDVGTGGVRAVDCMGLVECEGVYTRGCVEDHIG